MRLNGSSSFHKSRPQLDLHDLLGDQGKSAEITSITLAAIMAIATSHQNSGVMLEVYIRR